METVADLNAALAGRYEIERELGAGGMATVYLARDIRHDRHVALKVLRADLGVVLGPERFLAEIRVTANLQHPNLLPLFDSGEAMVPGYRQGSGALFYVMPYVEGESLRARLSREKQLPVDEAVHIAVAVASALEYAHSRGVIHRDLKPENILLQLGQPLVADFGIALAVSKAGGARVTQTGISLGTPQYMSPEQATGDRAIDGRSDIYSLGAVLYEMLTGEPPHTGSTAQAVIARVLTDIPRSVRVLRPNVPANVDAAIERALEKLPADRFATAQQFSEALRDKRAVPGRAARAARPARHWSWIAAGVIVGVLLGVVTMSVRSARETPGGAGPPMRASINLPKDAPLILGDLPSVGYNSPAVAVSPDGASLTYIAKSAAGSVIALRDMATAETRIVAGSEGVIDAFFSPDGDWIGFLTTTHVKKVPRAGGAVITLCEANQPVLGRWTSDHFIYFTETETSGLSRVASDGGKSEVVVTRGLLIGNTVPHFSDVLPDGSSALVTENVGIGGDYGDVSRIDLRTHRIKKLVHAAYSGLYVPPGYLLFARAGSVFGVRYDAARDTIVGDPTLLATGVAMESLFGILHAASSMNGVLVYAPYGDLSVGRIAWVDRRGGLTYTGAPERVYGTLAVAPDDNRIAVQVADVKDYVWVWDERRREGQRVVSQTMEGWPQWSRDGKRLAISNVLGNQISIVDEQPGVGQTHIATMPGVHAAVSDWSRSGDVLATSIFPKFRTRFTDLNGKTVGPDIDGVFPSFSSDARWFALTSAQSGQSEIIIRSYPEGRMVGQVSNGGGIEPRWKPSGDLYYRVGHLWYSTRVTTNPAPRWDPPKPVFNTDFIDTPGMSHDISADGQRLLVVKRARALDTSRIEIIGNWFQLLNASKRASPRSR